MRSARRTWPRRCSTGRVSMSDWSECLPVARVPSAVLMCGMVASNFCIGCGNRLEASSRFCASCGRAVHTEAAPASSGHYQSRTAWDPPRPSAVSAPKSPKSWRWLWITLGVFVVLIAIGGSTSDNKITTGISQTREAATAQAISTLAEQKEKGIKDRKSFIDLIRLDPTANTIVNNVRRGYDDDQLVIIVKNTWFIIPKQIRLQHAQNLGEVWARIHSPQRLEQSRISLVDINENSLGGSSGLFGTIKVND